MISADSLNRTGADFFLKGDLEAARLHYVAALKNDPLYVPAMANLAVVLATGNYLLAAATLLRRIVAITPNDGNQWNGLGNVLTRLELFSEAEAALQRAATLCPDAPAVWHNLGLLYGKMGRATDGRVCLETVMRLGNKSPQVMSDLGHCMLAEGRSLLDALVPYEHRWTSLSHSEAWDYHVPEWTGQSLAGKHILLHAEQGFGDTIMTARFAKLVRDRGAAVVLCVQKGLKRLFQMQEWEGIETVEFGELNETFMKQFDFQSPLFSTMRWLGVEWETIDPSPFLTTPKISVPNVRDDLVNVGICWSSGIRGGEMDWRHRLAPLELWLPLLDHVAVQLHSLQKDDAHNSVFDLNLDGLISMPVLGFTDWADTAAFLDKLDLVVTVDTGIAHLAGAMGKPVWMLSQFTSCWRWWDIENHTGRPWYDTMRIYPQDVPKNWKDQLLLVRDDLGEIIDQKQSTKRIAA